MLALPAVLFAIVLAPTLVLPSPILVLCSWLSAPIAVLLFTLVAALNVAKPSAVLLSPDNAPAIDVPPIPVL